MKKSIYLIAALIMLSISSCDLLNENSKEKEAIVNRIEEVCFNLGQGVYMSTENTNGADYPFYNYNASKLLMFTGLTGIAQMFTMYLGDSKGSFEILFIPTNIHVFEIEEKEAFVTFDLSVEVSGEEPKKRHVEMTLKKIAGNWKLDGEALLGDIK